MTDLISICICTYKRDVLEDTLSSLAKLTPSTQYDTEIIIADNDETPSAKSRVEAASLKYGLKVNYVHAPKQNISLARNACLDNANGNFVAFIDDDEFAAPDWLLRLYDRVKNEGFAIVFGPVWAIYPDESPEWMKQLNFHSTFITTLSPETGYTGNVIMNVEHQAIRGRRFNLQRGRTGGEDTQFFYECTQQGAIMGYAETADVWEEVTKPRLSVRWMFKVTFRSGLTLGLVRKKYYSFFERVTETILSAMKIAFCIGAAVLTFPFRKIRMNYLFRAAFHSGVLAANFNMSEEVLYG